MHLTLRQSGFGYFLSEWGVTVEDIGAILKRIRERNGYSMRKVASDTGFSLSFLSKLESGKSSITVKNLVKLLNYYGVTLADVFGQVKKEQYIYPLERRKIIESSESVKIETLVDLKGASMEPLIVRFNPRAKYFEEVEHGGEEFAIILKGNFRFEIDGVSYYMKEGDAAYFPGFKEHKWENVSEDFGEVLMITTPPSI